MRGQIAISRASKRIDPTAIRGSVRTRKPESKATKQRLAAVGVPALAGRAPRIIRLKAVHQRCAVRWQSAGRQGKSIQQQSADLFAPESLNSRRPATRCRWCPGFSRSRASHHPPKGGTPTMRGAFAICRTSRKIDPALIRGSVRTRKPESKATKQRLAAVGVPALAGRARRRIRLKAVHQRCAVRWQSAGRQEKSIQH